MYYVAGVLEYVQHVCMCLMLIEHTAHTYHFFTGLKKLFLVNSWVKHGLTGVLHTYIHTQVTSPFVLT